jgi:hypothetical protein
MTSMTNPTLGSNRSRAVFLAWWLLATSFGWILVAVPITFLITPTSGRFVGEEGIVFIFAYLYVVPSLGIMVASFLQWLLLRIYIRQSILWAILSVIGWIVGVTVVATLLSGIGRVVANLLPAFGQTPLDFLMVPIGGSLVCGILQWILIRKKIARSALWILASIVKAAHTPRSLRRSCPAVHGLPVYDFRHPCSDHRHYHDLASLQKPTG